MNPQFRRLVFAIVAWPAGFVAAAVLLILPMFSASQCPPGSRCAMALMPAPTWKVAVWLCVALAPGVFATRAWWNGRRGGD